MRRRLFGSTKGPVSPLMASAGDILLNDFYAHENIIVPIDDLNLTDYPSSQFLPTGVVVVPGSHDVYGDGSCGVMAIRTMCGEDIGNTVSDAENGLYVNGDSARSHIGFLYEKFPITDRSSYWVTGTVADPYNQVTYPGVDGSLLNYCILPSDLYSKEFVFNGITIPVGALCSYDTDSYYISAEFIDYLHEQGIFGYSSSNIGVCQSPYLTGGYRNTEFSRTTSPSSGQNSFCDFNGRGNTDSFLQFIEDSGYNICSDGISMFVFCSYFAAPGTSKTDWYLPAIGEWGYIMSRVRRINESIQYCKELYGGTVGVEVVTDSFGTGYVSSTEFNDEGGSMQSVRPVFCYFLHDGKRAYFYARSMMRMNADGIVKSSFVMPEGWDDCILEIAGGGSADSN